MWRSIIIWIICTVFIAPLSQQVPLDCEIATITAPDNTDPTMFISIRTLPNDNILYLTWDENGSEKLWLVDTNYEPHFIADVEVYYSMVPEMSVYEDKKFIYISNHKDTDQLSVEQIDLQTHTHEVLFEKIYYDSMFLRGDWLFVPTSHNTTVARNMITEEQVTLFFEEAGGQGTVKPLVKVTENQWLFHKDDYIFVADLATGFVQELTNNAIKVSYSDPLYTIFEDTLIFISSTDKHLIQMTFDGNIQQELSLQGAGTYQYLHRTEQGIVYTFGTNDSDRHLYFVNLANNNEIIHLNATTNSVSTSTFIKYENETPAKNALWYRTVSGELYYVELAPPFAPEFITQDEGMGSIYPENQHIIYHTNQGYFTVSNDRTHIQNIGADWGYRVSSDDKVYFRDNETNTVFRYDYVTQAVEKLGEIDGDEIRLFPVPNESFLYFQSDDRFGILSFDGAISVQDEHIRYVNEYPVSQDPHWGGVRELPNHAFIFNARLHPNLTYIQCHE